MQKTTIYRKPMGKSLFEEDFTVSFSASASSFSCGFIGVLIVQHPHDLRLSA